MIRKAVLLAAGRGSRLSPYTDDTPKSMIPLAGRPLIEYLLLHLRAIGITQILLVIGHLGEQITSHFGDGSAWDLAVAYAPQADLRGSGAAAMLGESFAGDEPFMLGWGDVLAAGFDYRRLAETYRADPSDALMMLEYVEDPHAGAAVYLEGDSIASIHEKPPVGTAGTHWNQAGLSIYSPEVFDYLRRLVPSERGELEFTGAVQALIDAGRNVRGVRMEFPRLHLTRPADIASVEAALCSDPTYNPLL